MERKFLSFLILCVCSPFMVFADTNSHQEIEMNRMQSSGSNHNAVVPEVTYDQDENTISVEFEAEGSFTLVVKDTNGQVLHSVPVVTNGNSYSYDVNLLPENYYVITITSVDDGYIGVLHTDGE